ncbi:TBC1 domain family member 15, partial [Ophiophagus hannah]
MLVTLLGTHPNERKITWKFLFGVYHEKSTTEERKELDRQMASQYQWMKHSWKQRFPWAATMRTQCDCDPNRSIMPAVELSLAIQKHNEDQREMEAANPPMDTNNENSASFQYVNEQQFQKALRDIDADIPRTDRHRTFFQREGLVKLLYLRDILITFAAFHQEIGYCRGMHYFASRFLETLDSETEAFWCFVGYMRRSAWGFTTTGVRRKIRKSSPVQEKVLSNTSCSLLIGVEVPAPITSVDRDEITFEVLLCIAVLIQNRKQLLQYQDVNDFFLFTQR